MFKIGDRVRYLGKNINIIRCRLAVRRHSAIMNIIQIKNR